MASPEGGTSTAIVVRSTVPQKSSYNDYREELRFDFWYACAYCTSSEMEAWGLGFAIDHYEPQSRREDLKNDYDNLMWSCSSCNGYKGDLAPTEDQRKAGLRFFRPDRDNPDDHIKLETVRVKPLSRAGEYTIETLYLNRYYLRRLREIRERLYKSSQGIIDGIRSLRRQSIDSFPPKIRARVLEIRKDLQRQAEGVATDLDELLRNFNKSILLDPDPEKKEQTVRRRNYLKKINALTPP